MQPEISHHQALSITILTTYDSIKLATFGRKKSVRGKARCRMNSGTSCNALLANQTQQKTERLAGQIDEDY